MDLDVAGALGEIPVGDPEGAAFLRNLEDLVPPDGVLEGRHAVAVASDLEGPVAALRRVGATEPEGIYDAEATAHCRLAGRRGRRWCCGVLGACGGARDFLNGNNYMAWVFKE